MFLKQYNYDAYMFNRSHNKLPASQAPYLLKYIPLGTPNAAALCVSSSA